MKTSCWVTSVCHSLLPPRKVSRCVEDSVDTEDRSTDSSALALIFYNSHFPLSSFPSIFIHTSPLLPCLLIIGTPHRWRDNPSSAQLVFHVLGRLTSFSLLSTDNCISLLVNSFQSLHRLPPMSFFWQLKFIFFTIMKPVNSARDVMPSSYV